MSASLDWHISLGFDFLLQMSTGFFEHGLFVWQCSLIMRCFLVHSFCLVGHSHAWLGIRMGIYVPSQLLLCIYMCTLCVCIMQMS